ncbi:MFS transporter [Corynebacterium kroppenstedtii]
MKTSFLLLGLLTMMVSLACFLWVEEPDTSIMPRGTGRSDNQRSHQGPLHNKMVWTVAIASMFLTVPQFAILSFAAVFLIDVFHTPLMIASSALVVVQVVGGTVRIVMGHLTDRMCARVPTLRALSFFSSVSLAALALCSFTHLSWLVIALVVIAGTAANAWHGVAYTEIASVVPDKAATALGLENTAVFAMGFMTPLVIPLLLPHVGWIAVWSIAAGACFLSAVMFSRIRGV